MNAVSRVTFALAAAAVVMAPAMRAQIPGMPLFTNPRYATGLRIHADYGQPTSKTGPLGDIQVVQGGASLVLGPIGLFAAVGANKADLSTIGSCNSNPSSCQNTFVTVSGLAQLKVYGGGTNNASLSLFGGASMDVTAAQVAGVSGIKTLNIPLGVALGYHIPLGLASLNLWGAPRIALTRFTSCGGTCPSGSSKFGWAVGADLPIFRILSVRAAYDSQKFDTGGGTTATANVFGLGASIGIGGMR